MIHGKGEAHISPKTCENKLIRCDHWSGATGNVVGNFEREAPDQKCEVWLAARDSGANLSGKKFSAMHCVSSEWNWVKYERPLCSALVGESLVFLTSCVICPHTPNRTRFLHLFHRVSTFHSNLILKKITDTYDIHTTVCANKFWKWRQPTKITSMLLEISSKPITNRRKMSPDFDIKSSILESV